MKGTKLLAIAVSAALLGGCSTASLNPFGGNKDFTVSQPSDNTTAVKDQTVGLINDEGVKIYYTWLGNVERIEVTGVAPGWKCAGDPTTCEVLAEADAKERLIKYLYEETVSSDRSVKVITKTLDKARDNALNQLENGLQPQPVVEFDAEQVEAEVDRDMQYATQSSPSDDNTSRRTAERVERTIVSAVTNITSSGRLRGMRKIGYQIRNDGKTYVAVYRWSEKDQDAANSIRKLMFN